MAKFVGQEPYIFNALYKKNMPAHGSIKALAPAKTYHFDIEKAKEFFDMLLEAKHVKLDARHKIPSKEELRGRNYCVCETDVVR